MNLVVKVQKAAHFISEKFQGREGLAPGVRVPLILAWYFITYNLPAGYQPLNFVLLF